MTLKIHSGTINGAVQIDLKMFCMQVITGVRQWLPTVESTEIYKANYEHFAKRHPMGLAPFVVDVPVIG
jgi:hypothetical protein